MSWFSPAEHLDPKTAEVLKDLAEAGGSESAAVAEALNTIAENAVEDDIEQATNEYLMGCADEIIDAARYFIDRVKPPLVEALMAYAKQSGDVQKEACIYNPVSNTYLAGLPTLWTHFGERAFCFANKQDAEALLNRYPVELKSATVQVFE